MKNLVTLQVYLDRDIAWKTKSMLHANGITGLLNPEPIKSDISSNELRLQVKANDFKKAKELLEKFSQRH